MKYVRLVLTCVRPSASAIHYYTAQP